MLALLILLSLYINNSVKGDLTSTQKEVILSAHNLLRRNVNPVAADMVELVWDNKLEVVAQAYANKCIWAHNENRHAEFSAAGGSGFIGENLSSWKPGDFTVEERLQSWWDEFRVMPDGMNGVSWFAFDAGHYSQMAWAKTSTIGCGFVNANCHLGAYLSCNYAPSGNVLNNNVYSAGTPCSQCSSNFAFCNNGLCAAQDISTTIPTNTPTDVPTEASTGGGVRGIDQLCGGASDCCNPAAQCREFDGDCQTDDDCAGNLVCGSNNCPSAAAPYQFSADDNCCVSPHAFSGPLSTDIDGFGLGGFYTNSRAECEDLCIQQGNCEAIQYSESCAIGCDDRCILHDNVNAGANKVEDYDTFFLNRAVTQAPCWTDGIETDIPGNGHQHFSAGNLGDCQLACSADPLCVAIQFSANDLSCHLHDTQNVQGNLHKDYLVYLQRSCDNVCFTTPLATDIAGFGFGQAQASSLSDCREICKNTASCLAVQYSESCAPQCQSNCILHNNQDIKTGTPLVEDYRVSLAGSCDSCCISDNIMEDLPGIGFAAFHTDTREECQNACCTVSACKAVQYSPNQELGNNLNCLFHSHQNARGNVFKDFETYFIGPPTTENTEACEGCCYSDSISGDIAGIGFEQFEVASLDACKRACCANSDCQAIQYSTSCPFGCTYRCILHRRAQITGSLVEDYFVHTLVPCTVASDEISDSSVIQGSEISSSETAGTILTVDPPLGNTVNMDSLGSAGAPGGAAELDHLEPLGSTSTPGGAVDVDHLESSGSADAPGGAADVDPLESSGSASATVGAADGDSSSSGSGSQVIRNRDSVDDSGEVESSGSKDISRGHQLG